MKEFKKLYLLAKQNIKNFVNHFLSRTDSSVTPAVTDYLHTRHVDSSSPSSTYLRKFLSKKIDCILGFKSVLPARWLIL